MGRPWARTELGLRLPIAVVDRHLGTPRRGPFQGVALSVKGVGTGVGNGYLDFLFSDRAASGLRAPGASIVAAIVETPATSVYPQGKSLLVEPELIVR